MAGSAKSDFWPYRRPPPWVHSGTMLADDGIELLTDDQCLALLQTESLGRVGLSVGALPAIFPVNYRLVDGDILSRTGEELKRRAAMHGNVVCFEVDHIDWPMAEGWSILIVGMAVEIIDPAAHDLQDLRFTPLAGDSRGHLVRIRPEMMTGRKIILDYQPVSTRRASQAICTSSPQ